METGSFTCGNRQFRPLKLVVFPAETKCFPSRNKVFCQLKQSVSPAETTSSAYFPDNRSKNHGKRRSANLERKNIPNIFVGKSSGMPSSHKSTSECISTHV